MLSIIAIVLGVHALLPSQYTAVASVVVDIKSPDPIAGMVLQGSASPSYMITQLDVINSLRVARQVVRTLRLDTNAELHTRWIEDDSKGTFEVWIAELLRKHLDARPSRGSNVINVSYTATDPDFAAAVANAFVQAYLNTTVDLRVDPAKQYSSFFDERAKQARESLEQAQGKLAAFQRANGLIATDERLDVENARLAELSSQAVALEASLAESTGRQAQAQATPDRMSEVLVNPVVSALTADVARQEARLQELTSRLGDAHPQIVELRSNIAGLKAKLDAATARASGSVGVNNTVNKARVADLRASIAEQRAKVLRLKDLRAEAALLQREVENAQRSYDGVLSRLTQTSLESQTAQSNISALEYATPPTTPSSAGPLKTGLLGTLLGMVLAIATALVRERRDQRLRDTADLPLLLDQPVVAVIPSFARAIGIEAPRRRARKHLLPRAS
jgi:chain length determinant protein EpsF